MKNEVYHFVFCEDYWETNNPSKPFVYELLKKSIPFLFVSSIPSFEIFLNKYFDDDDKITVWIHHQANHKKTDEFGRFLGESIGDDLIGKYPKLKFKYISRDAEHPSKSNDTNKTPVIFSNDIIKEIDNPTNFQKISDFKAKSKILEMSKTKEKDSNPNINIHIENKDGTVNVPFNYASGKDITQSNEIKVKQLADTLTKEGVAPEDIEELKGILGIDNPNEENQFFGDKTNSWIQKMIDKAKSGTWAITVGAAGKLLADAIKIYYGWG